MTSRILTNSGIVQSSFNKYFAQRFKKEKETELKDYKVSLKFQLKDIISRLPLFPKLFPTPKSPTVDVFSLLLDSPGSEKVQIQLKLFEV